MQHTMELCDSKRYVDIIKINSFFVWMSRSSNIFFMRQSKVDLKHLFGIPKYFFATHVRLLNRTISIIDSDDRWANMWRSKQKISLIEVLIKSFCLVRALRSFELILQFFLHVAIENRIIELCWNISTVFVCSSKKNPQKIIFWSQKANNLCSKHRKIFWPSHIFFSLHKIALLAIHQWWCSPLNLSKFR